MTNIEIINTKEFILFCEYADMAHEDLSYRTDGMCETYEEYMFSAIASEYGIEIAKAWKASEIDELDFDETPADTFSFEEEQEVKLYINELDYRMNDLVENVVDYSDAFVAGQIHRMVETFRLDLQDYAAKTEERWFSDKFASAYNSVMDKVYKLEVKYLSKLDNEI